MRLTEKGAALFLKSFAAHRAHLRPFFERALTRKEADALKTGLLRIRDSFKRGTSEGART